MKVEKRDGTIQEFRFEKIKKVIEKVFSDKAVNEEVPEKFIEQVKQYFDNFIEKHDETFVMPIEDIQDVIRDFLIKKNKIKAAEALRIKKDGHASISLKMLNDKSYYIIELPSVKLRTFLDTDYTYLLKEEVLNECKIRKCFN